MKKTIYQCEICNEIREKEEILGCLFFNKLELYSCNLKEFYICEKHICRKCYKNIGQYFDVQN